MLFAFPDTAAPASDEEALKGRLWIDLIDPTPEDAATVERVFGLRPPSRAQLEEIEATSRLRVEAGALYMSSPLIARTESDGFIITPVGFVLSPEVCLTVRFAEIGAFASARERMASNPPASAAEVLATLLEEVVDRAADRLEKAADEITEAAHVIFADPPEGRRKLARETQRLRKVMVQVGRASDRLSRVRYVALCVDRMAGFIPEHCATALDPVMAGRLAAVRKDLASLEEFEASLSARVQLLHDAATGFISIDQNEVVKVLTIASVVGIPPVLVVGVYGMNFKVMPELNWPLGYPFALLLVVVSTVLPLAWFKRRGWF